jgi:hypothetical protein
LPGTFDSAIEILEDLESKRVKIGPRQRQPDLSSASVENPDAQFGLQFLNEQAQA